MVKKKTEQNYNVLVFPGGSEIGLEIHRALKYCRNIELFSAGIDNNSHAPFVFKMHFNLPSIYQKGWKNRLNRIIGENKIDFIYPAYDDIIIAKRRIGCLR